MKFLLSSIVFSVLISTGNYFFDFVQYTVPVYAMYIKTLSIVILIVFFYEYLLPVYNFKSIFFALSISLLISTVKILLRIYRLRKENLEVIQFSFQSQLTVLFMHIFLLITGLVILKLYNNTVPMLYLSYLVILLSFVFIRISYLIRNYKKQHGWSKSFSFFGIPLIVEFIADGLTCYFAQDGALSTIIFTQMYQIVLLLNYKQSSQLESTTAPLFFIILCVVKTLLLYVEYYSLINPFIVVFNISGEIVTFLLLSFYFST